MGLAHDSAPPTPQHLGETLCLSGRRRVRARLGSGPECRVIGRQRHERGQSEFPPLSSAHFHSTRGVPTAEVEVGPLTIPEKGREELSVST